MGVIKKSASKKKSAPKNPKKTKSESISSMSRMEAMLKETEQELSALQPKIDELEKYATKLAELKQTKQKLITLKLSLKSILNNFGNASDKMQAFDLLKLDVSNDKTSIKARSVANSVLEGTFFPDKAFEAANQYLRNPNSVNYEFFRAIVFHGGCANTQQIRQYLIENNIKTPGSGESFAEVPLTDISSRVNYLVRKGLIETIARGQFRSLLGWE